MKIATILPTRHLGIEECNDYHLCLAHLMKDEEYKAFFKRKAGEGCFVMMDNGVVETGVPMPIERLVKIAKEVGVSEMVLPDSIYDHDKTLEMGKSALEYLHEDKDMWGKVSIMAVPQGKDPDEWVDCARKMLDWPLYINTIGISKFVSAYFPNRYRALTAAPFLIESERSVHLLGCPGDPNEVALVEEMLHGLVRGVDSGIAAMFTKAGVLMNGVNKRPKIELDFSNDSLQPDLLACNVSFWLRRCLGAI